jgi:hypothetical protein
MSTKLDGFQVIKLVYDETLNRLRVDTGATITLGGELEVAIDQASDSIRIGDGVNLVTTTTIGPKVGLDVNIIAGGGGSVSVALDAFSKIPADNVLSVGSEDGTQTGTKHALVVDSSLRLRVYDIDANGFLTSIDSKLPASLGAQTVANSLAVNIASDQIVPISIASVPLPIGAATEAKQDAQITILNSIDAGIPTSLGQQLSANSMPVVLASDQSAIDVEVTGSLPLPLDAATETTLANLNSKFNTLGQKTSANSSPVVLASDQPAISVNLNNEPIKISGTEDGTPSGTEYLFVNNIRQQILVAHDRDQAITYADFGTKNQRVTQIDYTSATFPGIIARKTLTYTLVGNNYRRDNITWTILP